MVQTVQFAKLQLVYIAGCCIYFSWIIFPRGLKKIVNMGDLALLIDIGFFQMGM